MNCEKWLAKILKPGDWSICDDIREKAKKEGFSRKQLKDARKVLGVKTFHQFDEYSATGNWFWYRDN